MPTYSAYNITFQLPFSCPVLPLAATGSVPDVVVEDGRVPFHLSAPLAEDKQWEAETRRFLWRGGPRSGRFLVEEGERVTIERNPAAEDEMLRFFFLDAVLAAVLRQRGMLVLHANAAVTAPGAVAIAGESGAGKSTALAALLARGCAMLADDILALNLEQGGCVQALPGVPQLHLSEDAAEGLGQDISGLPRYPWRRMKAAVPAFAAMATGPAPLRALYLLRTHNGNGIHVQRLRGADKFAALQECVYGPLLREEHPGQFPLFAAVVDQVAVFRLERPAERWSVDDVAGAILSAGL